MDAYLATFSKMVETGIIDSSQNFRVYTKDRAKSQSTKRIGYNTCVYLLFDGIIVSYVGQTGYLQGRIRSHCCSRTIKFDTVLAIIMDRFGSDYSDVNAAERACIELFRPKNNKEWNPDYKKINGRRVYLPELKEILNEETVTK